MKKTFKIFTALLLLSLTQISCNKSVLDENPPNIIVADNLYINYEGFQNGLNGLYNQVRRCRGGVTLSSPTNDLMFEINSIGVDNGYGNFSSTPEQIYNGWGALNNAGYNGYSQIWAYLYETINSANTIVDRANVCAALNATQKSQIMAEARCIRAWAYRHLTYLWGDVPLTLHESTGSNIRTDWARTPVATVRAAMLNDWLYGDQNLPVTNTVDGRVLQGTVDHFLAETYLAINKPDSAKFYATKVTTNPSYALVSNRYGVNATQPGTPFTDMFLDGNSNRNQGNTEALWTMEYAYNVNGGDGYNIMRRYWVNRYSTISVSGKTPIILSAADGGRGIGRLAPTGFALSLYTPNKDDRGGNFAYRYYWLINNPASIPTGKKLGDTIFLNKPAVGSEKINNALWPNPTKWDYVVPGDLTFAISTSYNNQFLIRSAETYLLLAEADLSLGDLNGAATAINALRTRAHAALVTPAQITVDFILDERSRELFSEEDRRYTLLRTGTWLRRTQAYNTVAGPVITVRDQLLPIPQDVINANLTAVFPQNPGY